MNDDSPRVSGDMHGFPSLEVLRQNKTIKPNRKIIYNSETDKRSPPIRQKEKQKEKKKNKLWPSDSDRCRWSPDDMHVQVGLCSLNDLFGVAAFTAIFTFSLLALSIPFCWLLSLL